MEGAGRRGRKKFTSTTSAIDLSAAGIQKPNLFTFQPSLKKQYLSRKNCQCEKLKNVWARITLRFREGLKSFGGAMVELL